MKKLLNFEVTREELLDNQLSDCEVDSTTGSAAPSKHKKRKPLGKPIVDKPDKGSKKKDALISAAKKRAMELFESKSSNSQTLPAKETSLESNKIAELQKELQQVKELLHQKSKGDRSTMVETLGKSKMDSSVDGHNNIYVADLSADYCSDREEDDDVFHYKPIPKKYGFCAVSNETKTSNLKEHGHFLGQGSSTPIQRPASCSYEDPLEDLTPVPKIKYPKEHRSGQSKSPTENHSLTEGNTSLPKKIELIEGYGVYLTVRQLDEAEDQSCNSPTRLIRNLMMVFFTPTTLASSSCLGKKNYPALNSDIVGACIKYAQKKHPGTSRSILVDAINDKCANYRRKRIS